MNKVRKFERLGTRYGTYTLLGIAVFIFVLLFLIYMRVGETGGSRITVAIAVDPVIVLSWDKNSNTFIAVKIPADTVIDGVHGYGKYSLDALWRLGEMHKSDRELLAKSLEQALGLPVSYSIGMDNNALPVHQGELIGTIRSVFSAQGLLANSLRSVRSNIPFLTYVNLMVRLRTVRSDAFSVVDVSGDNVRSKEVRADGDGIYIFDPQRYDALVSDLFEDTAVRKERLSVTVLNTTGTPLLADRAGRILNHVGVFVVAVGNDPLPVDSCVLAGKKSSLSTSTARLIASTLTCRTEERNDAERSDLTVYIGRDYERIFQPTRTILP